MQEIRQIGEATWTGDEIRSSVHDFLNLYAQKPIADNQGGMKAPHAFATWFMLKKLQPKYVVESGVWKGQGTWLIEQAAPQAQIFSIDIDLKMRQYISPKAQYFSKDFSEINWNFLPDKQNALLFFDDHQNAIERIRQGKHLGFRDFIFEDNYPAKQGDCYSLKKAFQYAGFKPIPKPPAKGWRATLRQWLKPQPPQASGEVPPNHADADFLANVLQVYYEFPPVFQAQHTRWGDLWAEPDYPTPAPLYTQAENGLPELFYQEAVHYTWICYAKLKA